MSPDVIQTIMGAIGSVGFAVLFNVRGTKLLLFFLGGALAWDVYLVCTHNGSSMFVGLLCAAMAVAFLSEILAHCTPMNTALCLSNSLRKGNCLVIC